MHGTHSPAVPEPHLRHELTILIPAALASGAHQAGEESELVTFLAARALDPKGSGRVRLTQLKAACAPLFSNRQLRRVLGGSASVRYWELELDFLRLRSTESILASYVDEIPLNLEARAFLLALLNTRQRRGAALLAAALAGVEAPRSNHFISRFAGVDRQTVSAWMKDPVISAEILVRIPRWASR